MKTKIYKSEGYYRLLVNDDKVNHFHKSQDPILLGCITHYANTGFWTVLDFRLSTHCLPSAYLIDGIEEFVAKDEEEAQHVKNTLEHYRISNDNPLSFYWNRYYCTSFDGADKFPTQADNEKFLYVPRHACYSFKKANEKLMEMKTYWEAVRDDKITADHLIPNPNLQRSSSEFIFDRTMKKIKQQEQEQASKFKP